MKYKYLNFEGKRPNSTKQFVKKELIQYLKYEVKNKHYPTRKEIENNFNLKLDSVFGGIRDLYKSAGVKYYLKPNQSLKYEKAQRLLDMITNNLTQFNLKLIKSRKVNEHGIDILAKSNKEIIGIELKAYNPGEKVKKRDMKQIQRFIKNEKLDRAILITTTNKHENNIDFENIEIIYLSELENIFGSTYKKDLDFIKNFSVNYKSNNFIENKKRILYHVKNNYELNKKTLTVLEINKALKLNTQTYFPSLFDIYKKLEIPIHSKKMRGPRSKNPDKELIDLWKNKFKEYILKVVEEEQRYPSGCEIGNKFGITHIWNITTTTELYEELGLKPYRKRTNRNLIEAT